MLVNSNDYIQNKRIMSVKSSLRNAEPCIQETVPSLANRLVWVRCIAFLQSLFAGSLSWRRWSLYISPRDQATCFHNKFRQNQQKTHVGVLRRAAQCWRQLLRVLHPVNCGLFDLSPSNRENINSLHASPRRWWYQWKFSWKHLAWMHLFEVSAFQQGGDIELIINWLCFESFYGYCLDLLLTIRLFIGSRVLIQLSKNYMWWTFNTFRKISWIGGPHDLH